MIQMNQEQSFSVKCSVALLTVGGTYARNMGKTQQSVKLEFLPNTNLFQLNEILSASPQGAASSIAIQTHTQETS